MKFHTSLNETPVLILFKFPSDECRYSVATALNFHVAANNIESKGIGTAEFLGRLTKYLTLLIQEHCIMKRTARTQSQLPKIVHPKQPRFADVANVNPPKCNGGSLLGGASLLIKASPVPVGLQLLFRIEWFEE
ncbi:hypothetical protein HNY73_012137 [Argiope bruennichi]|uniref:Uncharacterized protein n=1 Tax=Argiope bruennichi TaxID=94029 RepID=A0A8T0EZL0_ARGBR|nr:hypothetical protein HNY73_012137 [Argiope bruennichi]